MGIISLNSINQLMFVMVKCCVLFGVRPIFLNVMYTSFGFKKFQIILTLSNETWNKILPSLSQAFTTHHSNVFTPILSLSEGRAGIAWVPCKKMLSPTPSDIFDLKGLSQ
jgi:hypothetical protein